MLKAECSSLNLTLQAAITILNVRLMHVLGGGSDAVIFEKVHKFRKVDYRTIQYIIFENVKFVFTSIPALEIGNVVFDNDVFC